MTRISAAAATVLLLSTTGCVGAPPMASAPSSGPAMAAYFDCVRDGGVAISAHRAVSALDQPENSIAAIEATGREQGRGGVTVASLDPVRSVHHRRGLPRNPS